MTTVTAGGDNACGLRTGGTVACWGVMATMTGSLGPAAPTDPQAQVGTGVATVSWNAPADDAGAPVASYTVTTWPGENGCTTQAPVTSCVVSGLSQSTAVRFTVTATNVNGSSVPSPGTVAVVPGVCGVVPTGFTDEPVIPGFARRGASCLFQRDITTNNPYNPAGLVTRAQMAAFLWRMAGSPPSPSSCGFTDEGLIPPFARAGACWLKAQGITTINPYQPAGIVNRGQMAKFLWVFSGEPDSTSSCGFKDEASIRADFRPGACWLKATGITTNDPYKPIDPVSRGQMAAFLYRTGGHNAQWIRVDP
jgi:hypothetical protein